jgi:hypothetical protein
MSFESTRGISTDSISDERVCLHHPGRRLDDRDGRPGRRRHRALDRRDQRSHPALGGRKTALARVTAPGLACRQLGCSRPATAVPPPSRLFHPHDRHATNAAAPRRRPTAPVRITRGYTIHAEGSVLIEFGNTRVLCTASVEEKVPGTKAGSGEGWVTAEYGMLPRATHTRGDREAARGKQSGRTQEIQRLIGRSLRAVFDLKAGRAHHLARLRCAAGRRRHPHRRHHRRLCGGAGRGELAAGAAASWPVAHSAARWRPFRWASCRACRCWTWNTPKTPPATPT